MFTISLTLALILLSSPTQSKAFSAFKCLLCPAPVSYPQWAFQSVPAPAYRCQQDRRWFCHFLFPPDKIFTPHLCVCCLNTIFEFCPYLVSYLINAETLPQSTAFFHLPKEQTNAYFPAYYMFYCQSASQGYQLKTIWKIHPKEKLFFL